MSGCVDPKIGRLLHFYELGALDGNQLEEFELHLLRCTHCLKELQQFEHVSNLLKSDSDVRQVTSNVSSRAEETGSYPGKLWEYFWPKTPIIFRPALSYLVILIALVPSYFGVISLTGPRVLVVHQAIEFPSTRSLVTPSFSKSLSDYGLLSFTFAPAQTEDISNETVYIISIETEDSVVVYDNPNFRAFDQFNKGRLNLPLGRLKPGRYRLTIIADRPGTAEVSQKYYFKVVE